MATKELTEILQTAGAAGDASIGLDSAGGLVRRDSVPFDADGSAANSSDTDFFIGVSVSGDARMFNAIPYIKDDTAATPVVGDLVIGQGSDGSAKQFTVASLAVTLEGESFGTAAFVNTGSGADEVPLSGDLGTGAYLDQSEINYSGDTLTIDFFGATGYGTKTYVTHICILTIFDYMYGHVWGSYSLTSYTGTGQLKLTTGGLDIQFGGIIPCTYDAGSGPVLCYARMDNTGFFSFFNADGTELVAASSFELEMNGSVRRAAVPA